MPRPGQASRPRAAGPRPVPAEPRLRRGPRHGAAVALGTRFWLKLGPFCCFGDGKADLLERVDRLGSLFRAAGDMGMSYRHAWGLVRETEAAAGFRLLERAARERGTPLRLTGDGRHLVEAWRAFRGPLEAQVDAAFRRAFGAGRPRAGARKSPLTRRPA